MYHRICSEILPLQLQIGEQWNENVFTKHSLIISKILLFLIHFIHFLVMSVNMKLLFNIKVYITFELKEDKWMNAKRQIFLL